MDEHELIVAFQNGGKTLPPTQDILTPLRRLLLLVLSKTIIVNLSIQFLFCGCFFTPFDFSVISESWETLLKVLF
jgi:hypothetical protein